MQYFHLWEGNPGAFSQEIKFPLQISAYLQAGFWKTCRLNGLSKQRRQKSTESTHGQNFFVIWLLNNYIRIGPGCPVNSVKTVQTCDKIWMSTNFKISGVEYTNQESDMLWKFHISEHSWKLIYLWIRNVFTHTKKMQLRFSTPPLFQEI